MQPGGAGCTGYGQKWRDASLAVEWLGRQGGAPYPVPLLCGCFLAMRRDVFAEVGGFDAGMVLWGAEDSELSIRLWTLGYECWVAPAGRSAARFPRPVSLTRSNGSPCCTTGCGWPAFTSVPRRLLRVVERLKQYDEFAAASARLLAGDLGDRRVPNACDAPVRRRLVLRPVRNGNSSPNCPSRDANSLTGHESVPREYQCPATVRSARAWCRGNARRTCR